MRNPTTPTVRAAALVLAAVTVAATGACTGLDSAAAAQGSTAGDLAAGAADRLSSSAAMAYTATYHLAGGGEATIAQAQDPVRSVYRYPGGRIILTPAATTSCAGSRTRTVCTLTAPLDPASPQPADLFAAATRAGLVTPAAVLTRLNAAALDPGDALDQDDTTIAGQHATCVERGGTGGFAACITAAGVLGSFTGTVGGTAVDVKLTHLSDTASTESFAVPTGAALVDRR